MRVNPTLKVAARSVFELLRYWVRGNASQARGSAPATLGPAINGVWAWNTWKFGKQVDPSAIAPLPSTMRSMGSRPTMYV